MLAGPAILNLTMNDIIQTHPIGLPVATSSLADVCAAFARAERITFGQAWLAEPEARFRPATVRTGWTRGALLVFAELEDDSIYSNAVGLNDRTWEKGDVFEMFLRNPETPAYQEFHITPDNAKLQLRIPVRDDLVDREKRHAVMDAFELSEEVFSSSIWIGNGRWSLLAQIPLKELQLPENPVARELAFSFSRYDWTVGEPSPVLSSTSPHKEVNFHRQQEWRRLVFKEL